MLILLLLLQTAWETNPKIETTINTNFQPFTKIRWCLPSLWIAGIQKSTLARVSIVILTHPQMTLFTCSQVQCLTSSHSAPNPFTGLSGTYCQQNSSNHQPLLSSRWFAFLLSQKRDSPSKPLLPGNPLRRYLFFSPTLHTLWGEAGVFLNPFVASKTFLFPSKSQTL